MRQPETNTDIGINIPLTCNSHTAWWRFEDGRHFINLNVGKIFNEAKEIVEKSRGYSILDENYEPGDCPERWPAYDAYVDAFAEVLHESFLTELVCIERRRQGLRMNHPRCEPCCLARTVAFMTDYVNVRLKYIRYPIKVGGTS